MTDPERSWEPEARHALVEHTALDPTTARRLTRRLETDRRPAGGGVLRLALVLAAAAVVLVGAWRLTVPGEAPGDLVTYQLEGEGERIGREAFVLREGRVDVEVVPERGVDLTVSTDEATVRVVGTVFSVSREAWATEVEVARGEVAVTCVGASERRLRAGQRHRCLPDDLPTLLLRASHLAQDRAPLAVRLETLDRAAPFVPSDSDPAAGELLAHRVRALQDAGRLDDALATAERYLEAGHEARRVALLGFVARRRYDAAGCAAQTLLERAVAEGGPGPEALLLASCLVATDPERARELLRTSAPVVDGSWSEAVQQLRNALGGGTEAP